MKEMERVEVTHFDGLLVDYVQQYGGHAIIRGLRAISDFEHEFQMALMNRQLAAGYARLRPDGGLTMFIPDYGDIH